MYYLLGYFGRPRVSAVPMVATSVVTAYVVGKLSYRRHCEQKFMDLRSKYKQKFLRVPTKSQTLSDPRVSKLLGFDQTSDKSAIVNPSNQDSNVSSVHAPSNPECKDTPP